MAGKYTCPECETTLSRRQEPGEFALLGITNGRIQLHTDKPDTKVVAVRAEICSNCGLVTLYEAA